MARFIDDPRRDLHDMLISQDLMRHLAKFVAPPAQLCLIRVLGSDHEYVFRVRYGDSHLDYPCVVPLLDRADKVATSVNFDELIKALPAMSAMVVSPEARAAYSADRYRPSPYTPQILSPMSPEQFHLWDAIEYG